MLASYPWQNTSSLRSAGNSSRKSSRTPTGSECLISFARRLSARNPSSPRRLVPVLPPAHSPTHSPRASNTFTRSVRVPERTKQKGNEFPESDTDEAPRNRPFWSGVVTFGLVSIPVDLYPAVRTGGAPLRLVDADGTPLQRRYYCPEDGEDVPSEELIRGYELDDGRCVTV